ncbi:LysR family transcriptional regulator [Pseudomonas sp. 2(2015)]|uniref:LysR family transcriptional regulator n=1 Tax=Pseudomonas sp. 2(2015) TaxID=1619950 RepID=UPI0005EB7C4C|nr:LysR family transcriptional regulator [Pseudomonas sp. 2(2015)]KJK15309.1 LysR family transcriptional regulator [Pseudomonas sp. 2(2015)]
MLDVRKLRYFIAVADDLHFGRAAQRLHLAQPALTRQISALESQLGFRLFERSSRAVSLTGEGQQFLPYARGVLEQLTRSESFAAKLAAGTAGQLSIGYASSVALSDHFTQAIQQFSHAYPQVRLTLVEEASSAQWRNIVEGTLEIGLSRLLPPQEFTELQVQPLDQEPLLVALAANDPLAALDSISLSQLQAHAVVLYTDEQGTGLNDAIERLFQHCQLPLLRGPRGRQITSIIALVAAGQGIALVPACTRALNQRGVCYRPLNEAAASIDLLAISHRQRRSRAAEAFLQILARATTPCA